MLNGSKEQPLYLQRDVCAARRDNRHLRLLQSLLFVQRPHKLANSEASSRDVGRGGLGGEEGVCRRCLEAREGSAAGWQRKGLHCLRMKPRRGSAAAATRVPHGAEPVSLREPAGAAEQRLWRCCLFRGPSEASYAPEITETSGNNRKCGKRDRRQFSGVAANNRVCVCTQSKQSGASMRCKEDESPGRQPCVRPGSLKCCQKDSLIN